MIKKDKYRITSNQKKKKSYINWSVTKMNNTRLYSFMIILKQPKKRNSKEYMK